MSAFLGGSAYKMANQIADGFITASPNTFRKMKPHDLQSLTNELEKIQRELRGAAIDLDDVVAVQKKNRKMGRMTQALLVMRTAAAARR